MAGGGQGGTATYRRARPPPHVAIALPSLATDKKTQKNKSRPSSRDSQTPPRPAPTALPSVAPMARNPPKRNKSYVLAPAGARANRRQRPRFPQPRPAHQGRASSPLGFRWAAILPAAPALRLAAPSRATETERPGPAGWPLAPFPANHPPPVLPRPVRRGRPSPAAAAAAAAVHTERSSDGTLGLDGTSCGPAGRRLI